MDVMLAIHFRDVQIYCNILLVYLLRKKWMKELILRVKSKHNLDLNTLNEIYALSASQ